MLLQMASSNTLIQAMVPDALRGRVMAIYSMMFMGMAPFGALLAGTLADRIGAPATVAGGGVVCILGALVFGARLPTLRPQARRIILAQQAAAGEPVQGITGTAAAGEIALIVPLTEGERAYATCKPQTAIGAGNGRESGGITPAEAL